MTEVVRLLRFFKPARYELFLKPNKKQLLFKGNVRILGELVGNQKVLRLHAKGLEILSVEINGQPAKFKLLKAVDELQITLTKDYQKGEVVADIDFKAPITPQLHGIYPCYSSKKEIFIVTQFESHHAREAFPCIDEPAAKAVFSLTLSAPKNEAVISNTPKLSKTYKSNQQIVQFCDTPLMSTYLLAFVIGKLRCRRAKTKNGTLIRAWAAPDKINQVDYSLKAAKKTADFFNNYLDFPYPLKKLDLVALPDFGAGAMENWGLMTFRESCMLVDKQNTSLDTKQYVASVVAHEIAHQWFGNLVTMRWWSDLWLNEGFASWLEYLAVDHMFPKWHMWTQFLVSEQLPALRLDALDNTHPIEVKISHPDEIRSVFDAISYNKAACVVHMLHDFLGDKDFRKGLNSYLTDYAYSCSSTTDLCNSFGSVSSKPIKDFMSAWTSTPGFPLLEAKLSKNQLTIKQSRFTNKQAPTNKQKWPVPLLSPSLDTETLNAFKLTSKNLVSDDFYINHNHTGFYVTKYWPQQYQKLGQSVATGKLSENDSLGLISDLLAVIKINRLPIELLFDLLPYYRHSNSSPVWDSIAITLGDIRRVQGLDVREAIKPLVNHLTAKQAKRLGWREKVTDTYYDKLLRPLILALSDLSDNTAIIEEARKRFDAAKQVEDLDKNLRGMILISVARRGDTNDFNKMLAMYRATTSAEEKNTLADALTDFREPELIKRSLDLIKSNDVRIQDAIHWIIGAFSNPYSRDLAWKWIKVNWSWLRTSLSGDISYPRIPVFIARCYSEPNFLAEYKQFFAKVSEPGLKRSIKQGVETLNNQIEWRQRDEARLLKWLKDFKSQ
jgi:puromycin-sensitive aminopeptidase